MFVESGHPLGELLTEDLFGILDIEVEHAAKLPKQTLYQSNMENFVQNSHTQ